MKFNWLHTQDAEIDTSGAWLEALPPYTHADCFVLSRDGMIASSACLELPLSINCFARAIIAHPACERDHCIGDFAHYSLEKITRCFWHCALLRFLCVDGRRLFLSVRCELHFVTRVR